MKTVKKIFLYLLIACVIFTPYNVSAQSKDVTKAKSEDMKQNTKCGYRKHLVSY